MQTKLIITPQTKIGELLTAYPELESVLIDLAPAFKRLQNPVLRKTVARVTSIRQASAIGNLPVDVVVNKLRGIVGQGTLENIQDNQKPAGNKPVWLKDDNIKVRFDASEMIASGGHPLSHVMQDLKEWKSGNIYELTTPFLPAPLIDKLQSLGFETWTHKENDSLFRNYIYRD